MIAFPRRGYAQLCFCLISRYCFYRSTIWNLLYFFITSYISETDNSSDPGSNTVYRWGNQPYDITLLANMWPCWLHALKPPANTPLWVILKLYDYSTWVWYNGGTRNPRWELNQNEPAAMYASALALFATLGWKPMKSKSEVAVRVCCHGEERALVNNSAGIFRVGSVAGVEGRTLDRTLLRLAK